ncbi:hypothetical protein [Sorangium sp. So ce1000]|uniref:hypothetical protein n=1 Tax=Sorangium sp. So ce1000 TaxID=3133325 RepID=UPI003F647C89
MSSSLLRPPDEIKLVSSVLYQPLMTRMDRIQTRAGAGLLAFYVNLLGLVACSSPSTSLDKTVSKASFALTFRTEPGQETHWCQYLRLPKGVSDEVMLTGYRWKMTSMHHWSLYRATPDVPQDVPTDQPFDCFAPGAADYTQAAALTQEHELEDQTAFAPGSGFALESGGLFVFQSHTVNATDQPIEPTISFELDLADPAEVPNRLGLIQFYDPFIVVPPHAEATARMRCEIPKDLTLIRRWGHMHVHGAEANVFLDPPGGPVGATPITSTTDWAHPPIQLDTLELPKGSQVRMECKYLGGDKLVLQGPDKLDDEMCMFIAYYYPELTPEEGKTDFENCTRGDWYGSGTKTCKDLLACIQACPQGEAPVIANTKVDVGPCWQQCVVDSCPSATTPFLDLRNCMDSNCASECAGFSFGDACTSCIANSCLSEYATCQTAACE